MDINCEDCNNKGWVNAYSYGSVNVPDGNYIQRCGNCNRIKSDREAVKAYNIYNSKSTGMLRKAIDLLHY